MSKKYYNNRNGNLAIEEFIQIIHDNKLDEWMRKFKSLTKPCPPKDLLDDSTQCFYCENCWRNSAEKVKEYKKYYKVFNQKYEKEDFDHEEE